MSNVAWPRRPDLCNKDGRDCRRYENREWRFKDSGGNEVGWLYVAGDYGMMFKIPGVTVEQVR